MTKTLARTVDEESQRTHQRSTYAGAEDASPSSPQVRSRLQDGDRVVIIGAGPAGLTAAYLLAKAGIPVTVLEGDSVVGGLSRTVEYKGYRFDIGGHRFFTKFPPVEQLWEEVLGAEFLSVPRLSRIFYNGKYFDYPLKPLNALIGLGVAQSARVIGSYLRSQIAPERREVNLEQWVSNRFGKRLFEIFFKSYTEKVWGIPCTELSAEWAAQRIQNLSLGRAILSATPLTRRSEAVRTLIEEFRYPRLGPGQMWEMTRDRIVELGGEILLNHRVESIRLEEGRVVSVEARSPDGVRRLNGEHFISTMPIRSLVRALDPAPPTEVTAAAEGLSYRDFLVVALILDQENPFPDNWIYVHSSEVRVGRIQNFNNWSAAMVPQPGRTCLGLEYFCFKGDGLWTSSDEELVELAKREIGKLGLADPSRVKDGVVIRMPKAYPVYDGTYRAHLDQIRSHLDPIPNLSLVGRNGMHKYNNQDHSMLTAMMAVWNLQGASNDLWAVNTDYEYHEEMRHPEIPRPQRVHRAGGVSS
jgi:protoporphyrinogen oxidase